MDNLTGSGVRIGVVDSGWDRSRTVAQIRKGIGFVDATDGLTMLKSDDDHDRNGHGTACAQLILHVAPGAEIYPVRVFGKDLETSIDTLLAGIQWGINEGLHVLNVSLGTLLPEALYPLYAVCERARREGTILVTAVKNFSEWSYPALFNNVISVGADRAIQNFEYTWRPDEAIECITSGWELGSTEAIPRRWGTSFAAPKITGKVALLLQKHPNADLEQIRMLLGQHARAQVRLKKKQASKGTVSIKR